MDTPGPAPLEQTAAQEHGARKWRAVTLFLITAAGVLVCLLYTRSMLFAVTGAVTLGIVLDGPRTWLCRRLSPSLASAILLSALIIAVVLPGFFVIRSLVGELMVAVSAVQNGTVTDSLQAFSAKHHKMGSVLQTAIDQLAPGGPGREMAGTATAWIGRVLRGLATGITDVVLLLFLLFFVLRDRNTALESLASFIPLSAEETTPFLQRLSEVTHAIFLGRFLIAALQGTLAGLAYWALGVPGALLWGTVTAIFCLIPAFGAFITWVPIALFLGFSGSWTRALILALWGGLVIGNLDNFLYPVLVGKRTDLHTAVIFVSIFGGLALFGISGFVLGPVIVAATMLLLKIWKAEITST